MKANHYFVLPLVALSVGLSSCSNFSPANIVEEGKIGTVSEVYPCTVARVSDIKIQGDSTKATVLGSALGLAAGSLLGNGRGNTVATIGGAAVGGIAGDQIGKATNYELGQRIACRLDSGRVITVDQVIDKRQGKIYVGQRGEVNIGGNASRFIPTR